jgi:hypothetical protein
VSGPIPDATCEFELRFRRLEKTGPERRAPRTPAFGLSLAGPALANIHPRFMLHQLAGM